MKIGLYSENVKSVTYTIAYSIVLGGSELYLITSKKYQQENYLLQNIINLKNVNVIDNHDDFNIKLDILYIEFSNNYSRKDVLTWSKQAKSKAAICFYENNFRSQVKKFIKYFPVSLNFQTVIFVNGLPEFDLYKFLTKRYVLGFDVHSKFLEDKNLSNMMFCFDWNPQTSRKYKLNFLGNILPIERTEILKQIKLYLNLNPELINSINSIKNSNFECVWIEYGNNPAIKSQSLSSIEYINCLSNSDFTLCPPGYNKVTHRVVEALVRGSIPVINRGELQLYDMCLEDGINCIAVDEGNWISSIERLLNISADELTKMRLNILEMKDKHLLPNIFAKKLRKKMGIE
ncbi:MAG: hypothetical protein EA343_14105 [Nodularia sp. (in: Bacteria)]|nr:MAG: hypothetical protein EA343_14105 [Nodularia sp. (in: cyanobacteria)]